MVKWEQSREWSSALSYTLVSQNQPTNKYEYPTGIKRESYSALPNTSVL